MQSDTPKPRRLHISGFPTHINDPKELSERFSSFGSDIEIDGLYDIDGLYICNTSNDILLIKSFMKFYRATEEICFY